MSRLGLVGPIVDTGGAPEVNLNSPNIPYSPYGNSNTDGDGCISNRWQFLDDITWVKGKHTLKAGFEYRHHQFPFIGSPIPQEPTTSAMRKPQAGTLPAFS